MWVPRGLSGPVSQGLESLRILCALVCMSLIDLPSPRGITLAPPVGQTRRDAALTMPSWTLHHGHTLWGGGNSNQNICFTCMGIVTNTVPVLSRGIRCDWEA